MMRSSDALPSVYLCRAPVDFRKGIHGPAVLVEHDLERDPFSESIYVFTNRCRDAVQCLYWERTHQ